MSSETDPPRKSPPPPDIQKPPPPPDIPTSTTPPPPSSAAKTDSSVPPLQVNTRPDRDDEPDGPGSEVPLGTRVVAMLIDSAIGCGLALAVVIVARMSLGFLDFFAEPVFMAFILTRDGLPFLNGQSPGKSAMKIKAVTIEGESLAGNWTPALIRNAVLLIPLFAIVELVVLVTREDKSDQGVRLGDEWAKTRVVRANPPTPMEESAS